MAYNPRDRYPGGPPLPPAAPPPDPHYYPEYDHYHQEPHHTELPYGQPPQSPYSPSYPTHQEQYPQYYPEAHSPYPLHPQPHHEQYPPQASTLDPYYVHQQPHQNGHEYYGDQYDPRGAHSGGDMGYATDEKIAHDHNEHYPPSFGGGMGGDHARNSFGTPTRGSVAAQMAAEGAIPEKAGLRMWRSDEHSGAFFRGGKGKCCGRCCCCTMIVVGLLVVGIVAGFLLWVRPPNATFNGIEPPTAGNQVDLQQGGFLLNFDLNIGVTNPNFFGASFSKISAKAYYPLNKTAPLGGGEMDNVQIKPHSNTTIHFPFQINYTTTFDPKHAILADIAYKCGFLGATKNKLKILAIAISPTFSSSNTFTCPLKQSDFTSVLGGQQSMSALQQMLTGSTTTDGQKKAKRWNEVQSSLQQTVLDRWKQELDPVELRDNLRLESIGIDWFDMRIIRDFVEQRTRRMDTNVGGGWGGLRDKVLELLGR